MAKVPLPSGLQEIQSSLEAGGGGRGGISGKPRVDSWPDSGVPL